MSSTSADKLEKGLDMYDGPDKAAEFEFNRTKDPATGQVPREKYLTALQKTIEVKNAAGFAPGGDESFGDGWIERGPTTDVVGATNGNTRANSGVASGRIRAVLVDAADVTGKTVWVGGVDGGIWKTTDITLASPTWTPVSDYFNNLSIGDICQVPGTPATMYFCTGEGFRNADGVRGNGVFKSTDNGVNWTQLTSTLGYTCNRIVCDAVGNIYLGTGSNNIFGAAGLLRSDDGGSSWTDITPTGSNVWIADLELSSTGRLHVTTGMGTTTTGMYRFTDMPATVISSTWTSATTPFPYPSGANCRVELGCNGNVLYALPSNTSAQVATIYKSTDGGANWAATAAQPTAGWANGQAWYSLAVDIDPSDPTMSCIVGGLDTWKTTNGGASWTKISEWVGTSGQYVHADIQKIVWYDGGNKLLFACDGGIHYSSNKGSTIRDRNVGLRIKQFYSCAIHPSTTNYFIAGAQDNGVHQYNNAGLSSTVEVTGGDGCGVVIDQLTPANQFGNYVFNVYNRSTDGGTNWSGIAFYKGSSSAPFYWGSFINPVDYDNTNKIIYAGGDANEFFRWTSCTTTSPDNYFVGGSPSFPSGASILKNISGFGAAKVSIVAVSPYTNNRVYFGTAGGRIVYIDDAHTAASFTPGANITQAGMPAGTVSCVNTGTDDNNLIASFSNYGVASVWVSTNGGTSWTSLDNNGVNLPDMPVRWCMFYPGDNTKAILATETGIWETSLINGTSTVWTANTSFPTVRTDMLKYRALDGTLAAATHGRGLWTNTINNMLTADFRSKATGNYSSAANWEFNTYGATYIDAGAAPAGGNNVVVQAAHTITVDAAQTISSGKTLTVNGTLNAGTNTISGAGAFTLTAGATFATSNTGANGISQNITVSGTKTFTDAANYTFNGASTAPFGSIFTTVRPNNVAVGANITLDKPVYVTGVLGFSGSSRTLTTGSNLTLGSTIGGTARIADLTKDFFTAGAVSGNSITGTATVERFIANAGHRAWHLLSGKAVTGARTVFEEWQESGSLAAGYGTWITSTAYTGGNGFDANNNNLSSIATHNQAGPSWVYTMPNTNVTVLSANQGYMLFVRGDRNYTATLPTPTATIATTLRTIGNVTQGTQAAVSVVSTGTGRTLIGNPYASPIDFESIYTTTNLIPTFYVWDATLTGSNGVGGFVLVDRNGGTYQTTPVVLGGATVNPNSRYIHSGQAFFLRATGGTANVVFSESSKASSVSAINPIINGPGNQQLLVNLMIANPGGNASLADGIRVKFDNSYLAATSDDDEKIGNFGENLSSYRNNKKLIVERRPLIDKNDTIFLYMSNTGIKDYRLQLGAIDFVQTLLPARLEDTYLGTRTDIDLSGGITNYDFSVTADAGSAATGRFRIVFGNAPVVSTGITKPGINIFPNPIVGRSIGMQFNDAAAGVYQLRLISNAGQVLLTRSITHGGAATFYTIDMDRHVSAGSYRMEIIRPDRTRTTRSLLIGKQ